MSNIDDTELDHPFDDDPEETATTVDQDASRLPGLRAILYNLSAAAVLAPTLSTGYTGVDEAEQAILALIAAAKPENLKLYSYQQLQDELDERDSNDQ